MADDKAKYQVMAARYKGACAKCKGQFAAGSDIVFDAESKETYHANCGRERYLAYWSTRLHQASVAINQFII